MEISRSEYAKQKEAEYRINFGRVLKDLLRDKNISQKQLSELMDLPAANISTWVSGKSLPRAEYIDKLETFFQAPIRKLAAELNEAPIEKIDDIEHLILSTQLTYKGELISSKQKLNIISMIKIILDK